MTVRELLDVLTNQTPEADLDQPFKVLINGQYIDVRQVEKHDPNGDGSDVWYSMTDKDLGL